MYQEDSTRRLKRANALPTAPRRRLQSHYFQAHKESCRIATAFCVLVELLGDACQLSPEGIATLQTICREVGCDFQPRLCSPVFCTAVVVLWLALHRDRFPSGYPSSCRWCCRETKMGTDFAQQCPCLVCDLHYCGVLAFGNYLVGTHSTHGGFLPVFWNAPTAYTHAATDIGCVVEWIQSKFRLTADENGCLAVLHNRNHMVTTFGNSEWVTQAAGKVQSKSVSCLHRLDRVRSSA